MILDFCSIFRIATDPNVSPFLGSLLHWKIFFHLYSHFASILVVSEIPNELLSQPRHARPHKTYHIDSVQSAIPRILNIHSISLRGIYRMRFSAALMH